MDVFKNNNPLKYNRIYDKDANIYKYNFKMYFGGKEGDKIYYGKPVIYDNTTGQLLTGSFMDYCLPRAGDLPPLATMSEGIPTKNNPLGSKGAGEIGTIGSLAPILNAVADAIGSDEFKMPVVPECVWRKLHAHGDVN